MDFAEIPDIASTGQDLSADWDGRAAQETAVDPDLAPPPDQGPIPDLGPDPCFESWGAWTCNQSGNCNASCSGHFDYTLLCNKIKCICDNGGSSVECAGPGGNPVCSDCEAAFAAGCCDGL